MSYNAQISRFYDEKILKFLNTYFIMNDFKLPLFSIPKWILWKKQMSELSQSNQK